MAKLTIGKSYIIREPHNLGLCFFANYCENCGNKIYLTPNEAQEFINNTSLYLQRQSLFDIIKGRVKIRLPKISLKIEWRKNSNDMAIGERGEEKSYSQVEGLTGVNGLLRLRYEREMHKKF